MGLSALVQATGASALPALDSPDWKLGRDADGVQVWTTRESGKAFDAYRAEVLLDAAPQRIAEKITNVDIFKTWAPRIREGRPLAKPNHSYLVYGMPFPVKDRDVVQKATLQTHADGSILIRMQAEPQAAPLQPGLVRIKDSDVLWHIVPERTGTRVRCIGYGDPGGGIPAFVVNMLLIEGPFETMRSLRRQF